MIPESIATALSQPLDPHRVTIMPDGPAKGSKYLTGQDVIETANRIFGYGAWGFELITPPICLEREDRYEVWGAHGVLHVEGGGSFSDFGTCVRNGKGPSGLEMAIKGAVTDCVKRCLRNYGDQFGLVLYEKGLTMADLNREFQQGGGAESAPLPPLDPPPEVKVSKGVPEWWPAFRKAKTDAHLTDAAIEAVLNEGPTVAAVVKWMEAEPDRHWSNLISLATAAQKEQFAGRT